MTKEEVNFTKSLIGKTLNIPAEEAASLLFETKDDGSGELKSTALSDVLKKDGDRIQLLKDAEKTAFDNGFSKAKGEALSKFEKDVKDRYKITTDKQGNELIAEVVAAQVKAQGVELDDDKIKISSPYLNMVDKLTKEKDDAIKTETDKFTELQTSHKKEEAFKEVSIEARRYIIEELQPVLPENKEKAEAQINRLIKDLSADGLSFDKKDGKILVLKDGKAHEDKHGHMVKFSDLVKNKSEEVWDFKEGEQRKAPGNTNDDDDDDSSKKKPENKSYSGVVPKNDEEYLKMISDETDEAVQIQITEAYTDK